LSRPDPKTTERRRADARRRAGLPLAGRLLAAALIAALAALLLPAAAAAHAVLVHTSPHAESTVSGSPGIVQFDFNEAVEADFGAIRVFDADGEPLPTGELTHPGGAPEKVATEIPPELADGVYTATYRVVSADGHPVSGGFSFGINVPVRTATRTAPAVAELLDRSEPGTALEVAYGAVRGIHYLALLILVGALFFAAIVRRRDERTPWPMTLLIASAFAGFATALLGLPLQGGLAAGVQLPDAFDSAIVRGAAETRTGLVWLVRAGAWLALLNLLVLARGWSMRMPWAVLTATLTGALVATIPVGGHASTIEPTAVLVPADLIHVIAAGAWLGGLVLLLATYWPRRGDDAGLESARRGAEATRRFSAMALPAILILLVSGLLETWFYVDGEIGSLLDGAWGWMILVKLALLGLIVALAAGNRRSLRSPGERVDRGAAASTLRRAMRIEVAIAVAVLAATAVLVRGVPPVSERSGPVDRRLDLGEIRVEMIIEPATVGPNDYHLYLFDRETGEQIDRVRQITLRLTQPERGVGQISLDVPYKSPAHYELLGPALGVPGTWEVDVDVRVSRFDVLTAETEIEVGSR